MIARVGLIGLIIFALCMGLIYGYKFITKNDFKHAAKVAIGGGFTFAIIILLTFLEMQ